MDSCLLFASLEDDEKKIDKLSKCLAKYAFYKSKIPSKRETGRRNRAAISPVYVTRYFSPNETYSGSRRRGFGIPEIRKSSLLSSPRNDTAKYTLDEYLTIQNVFNKLVKTYEHTI